MSIREAAEICYYDCLSIAEIETYFDVTFDDTEIQMINNEISKLFRADSPV